VELPLKYLHNLRRSRHHLEDRYLEIDHKYATPHLILCIYYKIFSSRLAGHTIKNSYDIDSHFRRVQTYLLTPEVAILLSIL
jgi:hypothetical protein